MSRGVTMSSSVGPGGAQFPPTLWSVVLMAGKSASTQSEKALATLCNSYWYPLYAYLRRRGYNSHDAQDLTQGFFLHLLEGHRLGNVRPEKGRFRSFLLTAFRNFVTDEQRRNQTQKRGGGIEVVSLDLELAEQLYAREPVDMSQDPERTFERRWALTVLDRVLAELKREYATSGKAERFAQLEPYLLSDDSSSTYAETGRQLGLSEGAVKMAILRLRQRARELFRAELMQTVATEEEVDGEVQHLFAVLGS